MSQHRIECSRRFQGEVSVRSKGDSLLLASDQEKAYDSVQEYTIRASLERFNLPELFISFVLCNLHHASSCFKTFYGPTREFQVETSVRQGDPLSPLVYICITDALHCGINFNPIYRKRTGYKLNDGNLMEETPSETIPQIDILTFVCSPLKPRRFR